MFKWLNNLIANKMIWRKREDAVGTWLSWKLHTCLVEFFSNSSDWDKRDSEYIKQGFKIGVLSDADVTTMQNYVRTSPLKSIKEANPLPFYVYAPINEQDLSVYAKWFRCYDVSSEDEALRRMLNNLIPQIRKCLGYRVRVVKVRCYGVLPNGPEFATNTWHSDHFPDGIHKALIFITPPGPLTGTTELRLDNGEIFTVEGPSGSWLFFNASRLFHRGVPSSKRERITLEVTFVPAFKQNANPVFPGDDAHYPVYPWIKTNY